MSTVSPHGRTTGRTLPLNNGDRMTQPEFHRRYEACPEDVKFELVGGIVYMTSPLTLPHSDYDDEVGFLLGMYRRATPGVQVLHNATTILGPRSEPQPDLGLRVRPDHGGQSKDADKYVEGPPELLVEIAASTRAIDMHQKRGDYLRAGIVEYIVVCVEEQELHWFHFPSRSVIRPGRDGVARSKIFPGLWLDVAALLRLDSERSSEVLQQGLASKAHAVFVRRLASAGRKHEGTAGTATP